MVEEKYVERKSAHLYISASPGVEEIIDAFTVSPGKKFKLERTFVFFPSGTAFELEVAVYRGHEKVKPTIGVYKGDGNSVEDKTAVWFGSGEPVKVWYKNLSTTDVRKCTVMLEGYEE